VILDFLQANEIVYNFVTIIFRWFNSYLVLNTQSNNSVQNMDKIWHATSDSNNLSFSFQTKVVPDFLESLSNCAQLFYYHLRVIS
jgi:hypothetical protein